jgi:steroid 5-alpha reductase family enzyme
MSLAMYAFISMGGDNTKLVGIVEVIGFGLYLFGSYINTKSEYSRHIWKLNPKNKGKLYTEGLFRYAMHINYFGDVVLFVGLALLTHFSLLVIPAFMMLNFIFNIIPSLDRYLEKKYRDQFVEYAKETKKLIPWIY